MKSKLTIIAVISVLLIAPFADASRIFLNGVDITDVREKTFKGVNTVRIDKKGDVHIEAPQYKVKVLETGGDYSVETRGDANTTGLSSKYYIASQGPAPRVQYRLRLEINGVHRLTIGAKDSSRIEEITGWLQKGENIIRITAEKKIGPEGRASTAKSDAVKVLIGSGHEEDKVVKMDSVKATFTCNASTTDTFTREYKLIVQ